jgi:hypothetical protein
MVAPHYARRLLAIPTRQDIIATHREPKGSEGDHREEDH